MPEEHDFRRRAKSGERRMLRAAIALSAATVLGAGVTPIAHAAPAIPTSSAVTTLANVVDPDAEIEALKQLKATYFRDVDSKQWLALRELFAPGAQVDTTGSLGPYFPSRDLFVAFTALTLSAINTRHKGYDPQLELTSDSTATGVWTMEDRLSVAGLITIRGSGHYIDTYEKIDGKWVVTSSKLTRSGFGLEFPALDHFVAGFGEVLNSQGPVAALQYAVTAVVNLPIDAVKALVGAVLSNFGGPPAKAEEIKVPPGSQDETNPEPSLARTAVAATASARTVAAGGPAPTSNLSGADATPSVKAPADGALTDPAVPAEGHTPPVDATGSPAKSPTTPDSVPSPTDAKDKPESTESGEPKSSTDPKDKPESKDSTEAKSSTDPKDKPESKSSTEAKDSTDSKDSGESQ